MRLHPLPLGSWHYSFLSFPRMVSDMPHNHHCSLSRVKILLPGGRTLSSPAAGLSPPRQQDSFLLGGRTLSSPVAGLSPPRWQDYRLGPSPWLTVAYTPSVIVWGLYRGFYAYTPSDLFLPWWQDSLLPGGRHTLAVLPGSRHTLAVLPSSRHTLAVLPGGRHILAVLPGSRHTLAVLPSSRHTLAVLPSGRHTLAVLLSGSYSMSSGTLTPPLQQALCPPWWQVRSVLPGCRHVRSSPAVGILCPPWQQAYWANLGPTHDRACFDVRLCPRLLPDGNPGSNGLVRVAVVGTFILSSSFKVEGPTTCYTAATM